MVLSNSLIISHSQVTRERRTEIYCVQDNSLISGTVVSTVMAGEEMILSLPAFSMAPVFRKNVCPCLNETDPAGIQLSWVTVIGWTSCLPGSDPMDHQFFAIPEASIDSHRKSSESVRFWQRLVVIVSGLIISCPKLIFFYLFLQILMQ